MSRPISRTTRYVHKTKPLATWKAQLQRSAKIVWIQASIKKLQQELFDLEQSPLPTTYIEQVELHPGDEGYEEAPEVFDELNYQGNFTWANIENSTPSKPE